VRFGFYHTGFLACLAEGLAATGNASHGLTTIDRALEQCGRREELWCRAEMSRVKGEVLLRGNDPREALAERQFVEALDWARRQGALSWELRAAMSLARLRRKNGNAEEAMAVLAGVYARFTEGFATADLVMARVLLDDRP
jgi:predicted ATPase